MVDEIFADEQQAAGSGPVVNSGTASTTAGETLWTIADHLGSVRNVVDNSGMVRQHVIYDSFGNRLLKQDYNASGSAIASDHADAIDLLFGYTGRDWEKDTELQNNRARWYDPTTGRWLSQDPIGFSAGDSNLYRYVGNGPTNATDPSGLEGEVPWYMKPVQWAHTFGHWRQDNMARRDAEYQQRVAYRNEVEAISLGHRGSAAQRELGMDYSEVQFWQEDLFYDKSMGSGIMDPLERECLYLGTGLTQDEAVLPLIKGAIEATGQKVLYDDDFYLNHPGRWPFDAAVGTASNPLTYPSLLVTGGGLVQGGRRMLALRGTGTMTVTHWGPANMSHLRQGDWVMTGMPPRYPFSGKMTLRCSKEYVPFKQRINVEVNDLI